jgi:hypothetical protein
MAKRKGFYDAAEAAIDDLFSDTSVSAEETLAMLKELRGMVECKIDAIMADLKRGRS